MSDSEFCVWPDCGERTHDDVPLCTAHFITVGHRFTKAFKVQLAEVRQALSPSEREDIQRRASGISVVYYVRIGNHVKIGFTNNLRRRIGGLRVDADAVLAAEPGDRVLEKRRHHEFADERVSRREDFNPSVRLLGHIDEVRAKHRDPMLLASRVGESGTRTP